jgi:hypothetical protein
MAMAESVKPLLPEIYTFELRQRYFYSAKGKGKGKGKNEDLRGVFERLVTKRVI